MGQAKIKRERKALKRHLIAETALIPSFTAGLGLFAAGNILNQAKYNLYGAIAFNVGVAVESFSIILELIENLKIESKIERAKAVGFTVAKLIVVSGFQAGLIEYYLSDTDKNSSAADLANLAGSEIFAAMIGVKTVLIVKALFDKLRPYFGDNPENLSKLDVAMSAVTSLVEIGGFAGGVTEFLMANRDPSHASTHARIGIGMYFAGVAGRAAGDIYKAVTNWSSLFGAKANEATPLLPFANPEDADPISYNNS